MTQTSQHGANTIGVGKKSRGTFVPKCFFSHFTVASELSVLLCMGYRPEDL